MHFVKLSIAVVLLAGCIGKGDGWVTGTLWLDNCKDGKPLGESFDAPKDFDLRVNFFSGEPMEDSNKSEEQRRNGLTLRIQNTSNNVEVSDGLLLQLVDLGLAAQSFARAEPIPISTSDICPGGNCALVEDDLRASIYLFSTCPDGRQPLTGSSYTLSPASSDPSCLQSTGQKAPECPTLTEADRQELLQLCESDFNDRSSYDAIGRLLGNACLFLCHLGDARRGQDVNELGGFRMSFGDRVAGILSMRIVDGRAVNLRSCAAAAGEMRGMFDFDLARGRSAQSFP